MGKIHITELENAKKWDKVGNKLESAMHVVFWVAVFGAILACCYILWISIGAVPTTAILSTIAVFSAAVYLSSKIGNARTTIKNAERYGVIDD